MLTHNSFHQQTAAFMSRLYDPLSYSTLPLVDGLSRKLLQYQGVSQESRSVNSINTNFYYNPARTWPRQEVPVLLLHGIADNAITWFWQIRSLNKIGPVYAVDLPGFGLSSCPSGKCYATFDDLRMFLEAFITNVIGKPTLVIGSSLGGWLAVRLAWTLSSLVRGIVLLNPGGAWLEGEYSWQPFVEMVQMQGLCDVRRVYRHMFGPVPWRWVLYLGQRSFQARFCCQTVNMFVNAFTGEEFLQSTDLQHLPVPAGLIWGMADNFLPVGSQEFFTTHLGNAPRLMLPGCGHLPQRERPYSVNRFVRTFAAHMAATPPFAQAQRASHTLPAMPQR